MIAGHDVWDVFLWGGFAMCCFLLRATTRLIVVFFSWFGRKGTIPNTLNVRFFRNKNYIWSFYWASFQNLWISWRTTYIFKTMLWTESSLGIFPLHNIKERRVEKRLATEIHACKIIVSKSRLLPSTWNPVEARIVFISRADDAAAFFPLYASRRCLGAVRLLCFFRHKQMQVREP